MRQNPSPEVSSVQNSTKVASKDEHCRSWAVVSIKYRDRDADSLLRGVHMEYARLPHLQLHLGGKWGNTRGGEGLEILTINSDFILNFSRSRHAVI